MGPIATSAPPGDRLMHDLRTQLNALVLSSHTLKLPQSREERAEALRSIRTACREVDRLIGEIELRDSGQ